jgi:hypothetical protein
MQRLGALPISLITAALVLGACQVPQAAHSQALHSAAQSQAPQSASTSSSAPQPTLFAAMPVASHDVPAIAPAARLSGDPKELVGLDHAVVRRALGNPTHIRSELPAQVWQYATGDCIVDLYLYDQDGAWTVTYVEARSHTAESAPTARCLKSLLERPTASAG